MEGCPLTDANRALVDVACTVIDGHFDADRHRIGAALQSDSGNVYTAVHLETDVGRAAVCAEPIAVGQAMMAGENGFDAVAAVKQSAQSETPVVVPPCGICRELLFDYDPSVTVVVPGRDGPVAVPIDMLIPGKPY